MSDAASPASRDHRFVVILSAKSSGSTALQRTLTTGNDRVHAAGWTSHHENETLYWTKAASILGLPQVRLADSVVPLPAEQARRELIEFLERNDVHGIDLSAAGAEHGVFDGWARLCERYGPVFLEKSPHHLHQSSVLELLMRCEREVPSAHGLMVGLVRNPMDVLYSSWRRWRYRPSVHQHEWVAAYQNLARLREHIPSVVTVRYEDMVATPEVLDPIRRFCGLGDGAETPLHQRSLAKWRTDPRYGFVLAPEVMDFAIELGYERSELTNVNRRFWFLREPVAHAQFHIRRTARRRKARSK